MRKLPWLFRIIIWIPLAYLAYRLFTNDLGAEPAVELNKTLGVVTLRLFILNLYIGVLIGFWRPFPQWLRWMSLERRFLGVSTFLYALLHVSFFFIKEGDLNHGFEEILKRIYLNFGAAAFVILFILFLTSNNISVRRLKYTNWKRLHRLVYFAALGISLHLLLIEKANILEALSYFVPIAILELVRLIRWILELKRRRTVNI